MAGCLERLDWELCPRAVALHERFAEPGAAGAAFARALLPEGRSGSFRPLQ